MTAVTYVVGAILTIAAACALYRVARGPSILDRVLAVDVILAIIGAALATRMVVTGNLDNLVFLVVASVVGFIGSVAVARFVTDRK